MLQIHTEPVHEIGLHYIGIHKTERSLDHIPLKRLTIRAKEKRDGNEKCLEQTASPDGMLAHCKKYQREDT
jgi:hypothetical protein